MGVEEASLQTVSVYPNPTTGKVKITLPENILPANMQVTNIIGEKILAARVTTNELTVELLWAEGIYMFSIIGENNFSQTIRVAKR